MYTLEQVDALIDGWTRIGISKAEIIVMTAERCLGWPYVFGARGEKCTPRNRDSRRNAAYPAIVDKCQVLSSAQKSREALATGRTDLCQGCAWGEGARMYDCRGFTYWLLYVAGITLRGAGATSQWNDNSNWARKGPIDEMPLDRVCCVFKKVGGTMSHTGMYVLGGKIIHCSGTVKTGKITDRGWTHYGLPAGLYGDEPMPETKPTLRRGDRGEWVKIMQERLMEKGYDLGAAGADGAFGKQTEKAVQAFQRDKGLTVDGVVGPKTWAALEPQEDADTRRYTVVIPGVDAATATYLLESYPGARAEETE